MKNRHHLPKGLPASLLLATLFLVMGLQAETEIHDLDPYPVESGPEVSRWEAALEGGLLIEPEAAGRAMTWMDDIALNNHAVSSMEDLMPFLPAASPQARFGVLSVPTIRGAPAIALFNGQRRADHLFGVPVSFAYISAVETIAGPPLLSAGTGKRTGGMVNFISLRPREESGGSLSLRLGTWVPGSEGGSFLTLEAHLRAHQVFEEGQALTVVLGGRNDETFYHRNGGHDDARDLYLAWRMNGNRGSRWDLIFLYQGLERPQSLGVNRPWQGLLDDGLYVRGGVDPDVGNGMEPTPFDPGVADPGLIRSGADDLSVINRDRVLMSVGDRGSADVWLGQLIFQSPSGKEGFFKQQVLLEKVQSAKENAFLYADRVNQFTLDSLSTLAFEQGSLSLPGPALLADIGVQTGLHLRYEERDNRANYWNELAYAFDIAEGRRFSAEEAFAEYIAPGAVVEGEEAWYLPSSLFSTPESTTSELFQAAVFAKLHAGASEGWHWSLEARFDQLWVEAREPDSLGLGWRDTRSFPVGSLSLTVTRPYRFGEVYVTAGTFGGVAGNTVGDGINLYPPGNLHEEDFRNRSQLLELGLQVRPGDAVQVRIHAYMQERERMEFFGANDIKVQGLELEGLWQLSPGTRLQINGHLLDARYDEAAPAEFGGGSLWNVYAPDAGPTGEGNGLGYIRGFFLGSVPAADYRVPGLARWQVQAAIEQRVSERLVLRFWGAWRGEQPGNLAGEYVIPAQSEWNLSATLNWRRMELQVVARNLFDADNWMHNGDTFFNQMFLSRALPRRLEMRLSIDY
jgi:hypothetical protein